ncbi:MAG: TIGR03936 family radical SAM-associated protein [Anaerovoracaceae bacterium]|jgi:radical SAM-linked protein
MPRYRVTFSKGGYIRFTSHLDMIRLFERAFRRAGIELEYSQGFNPHPKMVFAQPLPLGYSSEGEILEADTTEEYECRDLAARLDAEMPDGIVIKSMKEVEKTKKTAASTCRAADYRIEIEDADADLLDKTVKEMLSREHLTVEKKTKRGMRTLDIRPMIKSMEISESDDKIILLTKLDAGSSSNLAPQVLLDAMSRLSKIDIPPECVEITRLRLYI